MKIRTSLICFFLMLTASAVWAQTSSSTPKSSGLLGYLDAQTGAFRPVPQVGKNSAGPAALSTVTGHIQIKFVILAKSPAISRVECSSFTTVVDTARVYEESATALATGSGGSWLCTVNVPYSWSLANPSSAEMITSYVVRATGPGLSGENVDRSSRLSPFDARIVPPSGVSTLLTADVTM